MWRTMSVCAMAAMLAALGFTLSNQADAAAPELPEGYQVLLAEDFTSPVSPDWVTRNGEWTLSDGAWQGAERAEDKHAATARRALEFTDGVIEFDFKLDGARMISLSINDAKGHVCRLLVLPNMIRIQKDDHDHEGPDMAAPLANVQHELAPGVWHHVRFEMKGDTLSAQVDDLALTGAHDFIARPKTNVGLVVAGQSASFRNLRIYSPK